MTADVQVFLPGSAAYLDATSPHTSSVTQRPAYVARPREPGDVAEIVRDCRRRGLTLVPQSTGHGAAGDLGPDTVVLDTRGLDRLQLDPTARTAVAGAGLTWRTVNAEAYQHGLLGLAGSAPSVSLCGYTFGGGVGWLSRQHGLASSMLRRVDYVGGSGNVRRAADDAEDPVDREAMWAFRGGGGVGIAVALEFGLVPVPDLHAGYFLWPAAALDDVVSAWAEILPLIAPDVATSISVLHTPPGPPFPEHLRNQPVVHLAVAANGGQAGAAPLLNAIRSAAIPDVNIWGPADAALLGRIHLDPPVATPAIGDARWLDASTPGVAASLLEVAAPRDSALTLLEIRHVSSDAPAPPGATSTMPGDFIVHAVGALTTPARRAPIEASLTEVRGVAAPADVGLSVGSWMEGAQSVPDALPAATRRRVADIADTIDPDAVLQRNRFVV